MLDVDVIQKPSVSFLKPSPPSSLSLCQPFQQACISSLAGFPYSILAEGHYVPGVQRWETLSRYKGKDIWKTIMHITEQCTVLYGMRVILSFETQVGKDSSAKNKASDVNNCFKLVQSPPPTRSHPRPFSESFANEPGRSP